MNEKVYCGTISHKSKNLKVEWEIETHLVWVVDENGKKINYGEAKAISKSSVLECAKEMVISSGL